VAWSFVLCDASGQVLGELNDARDRKLRFALSQPATLAFKVRHQHPMAPLLRGMDRVLVKGYDNRTGTKVLRFLGVVTGREKVRRDLAGEVAVNATSPVWRLAKRLIGRSQQGVSFGTALAPVTRASIVQSIIDGLLTGSNGAVASDTGVRSGTITSASSTYAGPWTYKPALQALNEVVGTLDGMDWVATPVEPVADAWGVKLCQVDASPVIGTYKPEAVWEFGDGRRNVAEWSEQLATEFLCNLPYHLPPGWPENATQQVVFAQDLDSILARGVYEDVISADLSVDQLRTRLVQEHAALRSRPKQTVTFKPTPDYAVAGQAMPRLFTDFAVGDAVPFRAVERVETRNAATGAVTGYTKLTEIAGTLRVYAAELSIDDDGAEQPEFTLIDDRTVS